MPPIEGQSSGLTAKLSAPLVTNLEIIRQKLLRFMSYPGLPENITVYFSGGFPWQNEVINKRLSHLQGEARQAFETKIVDFENCSDLDFCIVCKPADINDPVFRSAIIAAADSTQQPVIIPSKDGEIEPYILYRFNRQDWCVQTNESPVLHSLQTVYILNGDVLEERRPPFGTQDEFLLNPILFDVKRDHAIIDQTQNNLNTLAHLFKVLLKAIDLEIEPAADTSVFFNALARERKQPNRLDSAFNTFFYNHHQHYDYGTRSYPATRIYDDAIKKLKIKLGVITWSGTEYFNFNRLYAEYLIAKEMADAMRRDALSKNIEGDAPSPSGEFWEEDLRESATKAANGDVVAEEQIYRQKLIERGEKFIGARFKPSGKLHVFLEELYRSVAFLESTKGSVNDLEQAIKIFRQMPSHIQKTAFLYNKLGLALQNERPVEAIANFNKALDIYKSHEDKYQRRTAVLINCGNAQFQLGISLIKKNGLRNEQYVEYCKQGIFDLKKSGSYVQMSFCQLELSLLLHQNKMHTQSDLHDRDSLRILDNIASSDLILQVRKIYFLIRVSEFKKAKEFCKKIYERERNSDDFLLEDIVVNIIHAYILTGHIEETEEYFKILLNLVFDKGYEFFSEEASAALSELFTFLTKNNKLITIEFFLKKLIAIKDKYLEIDDAWCNNNLSLGVILEKQKKYKEAIKYFSRSLVGREKIANKTPGQENKKIVAEERQVLAKSYTNTKDYDNAIVVFNQSLTLIVELMCAEEDLPWCFKQAMVALAYLSQIFCMLKKQNAAKIYLNAAKILGFRIKQQDDKILSISERFLQITEKEFLSDAKKLNDQGAGELLLSQKYFDLAFRTFQNKLLNFTLEDRTLPAAAPCYRKLTEVLLAQGQLELAHRYLDKAVVLEKTADNDFLRAEIFLAQQNFIAAKKHFSDALEGYQTNSLKKKCCLRELGFIEINLNNPKIGETYFDQALLISSVLYDKNSVETAHLFNGLAQAFFAQENQRDEAKQTILIYFENVLNAYRHTYGNLNEKVISTLLNFAKAKFFYDQKQEAATLIHEAFFLSSLLYGEQSAQAQACVDLLKPLSPQGFSLFVRPA